MKYSLIASPTQARQTKEQFANPEDYLSSELGRAVQELPPLYTRLLAASLSLLVFGAISWAHFSKVEEVAVAQGELIASVQVRPVRALGEGAITEVKVSEGDFVTKKEILIERDPTLKQAEVDRLAQSARLIREDLARLEAERTGNIIAGTALQDQLLAARLQDFKARYAAARAEANRQLAVINAAKIRLDRLQENLVNAKTNLAYARTSLAKAEIIFRKTQARLEIARKTEQALETLLEPGAIAKLQYLAAQDRVIQTEADLTKAEDEITRTRDKITEIQDKITSLEKDIAIQEEEIRQAEQAYQAARNRSARLESERQSEILTQLTKRREELTTVEGQLKEARKRHEGETIKAPLAGTVYNVKATQGPVQPGEDLLSILPEGEELLLEVKVLNRDIGFIREGMRAKVKMATFPFQEFGTVDGTVVKISPNAIKDEKLGLVFPTRIKLHQNSLQVRGREVRFTPGMVATGEIVTRRKSILTFLIEPVTRRFSEAFSVR
ncbi:MAG: HlyD family efflux transporter periplasmic adaptor subunit [Prochloraceae cyanobacterium]|nr:HlyD family efflux transporter periplasmic adaptor subunit [Prochloraceae cyanobacterium]